MRNLLTGAALCLGLLACGAAAAHQWDEGRIADLEWEADQLRDRVEALEAAVWPLDDFGPLGPVGQLGTTWPGDDGGR